MKETVTFKQVISNKMSDERFKREYRCLRAFLLILLANPFTYLFDKIVPGGIPVQRRHIR